MTCGGEHRAQQRRTHKAGFQHPAIQFQPIRKIVPDSSGIRTQAIFDGQQQPRLGGNRAASFGREVFFPDSGQNLLRQGFVLGRVRCFSQNPRGLGRQLGAIAVLGAGNHPHIRAASLLLRVWPIKCQPIPIVEMPPPAIVIAVHGGDVIHPCGHGGVLLLQNGLVPVKFIQRPGDDAGGIAPGGGAAGLSEAGHHIRHRPGIALLLRPEIV